MSAVCKSSLESVSVVNKVTKKSNSLTSLKLTYLDIGCNLESIRTTSTCSQIIEDKLKATDLHIDIRSTTATDDIIQQSIKLTDDLETGSNNSQLAAHIQ
jgi:hypothetical protein